MECPEEDAFFKLWFNCDLRSFFRSEKLRGWVVRYVWRNDVVKVDTRWVLLVEVYYRIEFW